MSSKKKISTPTTKKTNPEIKKQDIKIKRVFNFTSLRDPVAPKECPFIVGRYTATRMSFVNDGKMQREWRNVYICSSVNLAKDEKKSHKILNEFMEKDFNSGWYFDDDSAIENALMTVEHLIAQGAVSIEYGDIKCACCIARKMRNIADALRIVRTLKNKRLDIYRYIDLANGEMPAILPPDHEWDKWKVVDGVYKNVAPVSYDLTKEQADEISSALSKITGDGIEGKNALIEIYK